MASSTDALAALAPKLRHTLPKIRARALASLVFKLRERLADARALEGDRSAAAALVAALVACCAEPALEVDALLALELLLEVRVQLVDAVAVQVLTMRMPAERRAGAARVSAEQRGGGAAAARVDGAQQRAPSRVREGGSRCAAVCGEVEDELG